MREITSGTILLLICCVFKGCNNGGYEKYGMVAIYAEQELIDMENNINLFKEFTEYEEFEKNNFDDRISGFKKYY